MSKAYALSLFSEEGQETVLIVSEDRRRVEDILFALDIKTKNFDSDDFLAFAGAESLPNGAPPRIGVHDTGFGPSYTAVLSGREI